MTREMCGSKNEVYTESLRTKDRSYSSTKPKCASLTPHGNVVPVVHVADG